jgi:ubiquitin-conjugating enzyme E2 variant
LKLFCDTDYPDKPPTVQFQSRINMTCVNQETGLVLMHSFSSVPTFEAVYE